MTTDTQFSQVVSYLENFEGEGNARTLFQIGDHLKIPRRDLEHLIETRLGDFPFPVCSTGEGYFRPLTADEANRSRHYKQTRFAKLQARIQTEERLLLRAGFRMEGGAFVTKPKQAELF